tara:strand:+ start:225 stop:605 length:381 start_codon:yes stop_codon:yes gene_type:complete
MAKLAKITLISLFAFMVSCAQGHCRKSEMIGEARAQTKTSAEPSDSKTIKVFKADGSRQCEKDSGVSLDVMSKQLGPIKIYSSKKQHDGLMHASVCGGITGYVNVYEIDASQLKSAEDSGFKVWKK